MCRISHKSPTSLFPIRPALCWVTVGSPRALKQPTVTTTSRCAHTCSVQKHAKPESSVAFILHGCERVQTSDFPKHFFDLWKVSSCATLWSIRCNHIFSSGRNSSLGQGCFCKLGLGKEGVLLQSLGFGITCSELRLCSLPTLTVKHTNMGQRRKLIKSRHLNIPWGGTLPWLSWVW